MLAPHGFECDVVGEEVVVRHLGAGATTLRGRRARQFLEDVQGGADAQELMARITGNDKHGNERTALHHPRNEPR